MSEVTQNTVNVAGVDERLAEAVHVMADAQRKFAAAFDALFEVSKECAGELVWAAVCDADGAKTSVGRYSRMIELAMLKEAGL